MKKLLSLLVIGCVFGACKKEVKKDPPPQQFTYRFSVLPSGGMVMVNSGDTTYLNVHIALGAGPGGFLNLSIHQDMPGVHIYLSQDKGIPPFDVSIMITADDTMHETSGGASISMTGSNAAFSDNYLFNIAVFPPFFDTTSDCAAALAGTYKFTTSPDTNHYFTEVITVPNTINKLKIANIDGLGDTANLNLVCLDNSFIIPFQHLAPGKFIEGNGFLYDQGNIDFDITESSSGAHTHYRFNLTK